MSRVRLAVAMVAIISGACFAIIYWTVHLRLGLRGLAPLPLHWAPFLSSASAVVITLAVARIIRSKAYLLIGFSFLAYWIYQPLLHWLHGTWPLLRQAVTVGVPIIGIALALISVPVFWKEMRPRLRMPD